MLTMRKTRRTSTSIAAAFLGMAAVACASVEETYDASDPAVNAAAEAITADGFLAQIRDLSADSMEGRGPGTTGEAKAVAYLERRFREIGLEPGNPDGSYIQNVDLIGYTSSPRASITAGGRPFTLRFPDDYVASSRHDRPRTTVENSEIVFVGYGVVAPEYGWDDYKDVDVRGKTILMLVNDPAVPALDDPEALDTTMFKGRAMTYYGRWTYKYEIASEKGAAAAIIIHETGPAGYPYDVVKGSFALEQFDVPSPNAGTRVPVEGWITFNRARELFLQAGLSLDALKVAAKSSGFKPVSLNGATANFDIGINVRRIQSKNVVGRLPGSELPDEHVIYTAHWDHLGVNPTLRGDQINNGALDNASGTSAILEIAKAFKALPTPPKRSVLFLAVTAEEKGLLGAKYYAQNPLYPLNRTAANINFDGINQWGRTSDFTIIGLGNSELDDITTSVLAADNRTVRPDAEPEKGFYYRSDHFEFAKEGVPALYFDAGVTFVGKPEDYGMQKRNEYTTNDYHKPSDEVKPDWDLTGAVDDTRAMFRVGYIVAQQSRFPEWKPGTEFKAKRDSMMSAGR